MTKQDNKDKLRVYEYAKSLNMSSKEIITILKRVDMPVNNHMSVMEPQMIEKVEKFFHDLKTSAAAKRNEGGTTKPAAVRAAAPEVKENPAPQQNSAANANANSSPARAKTAAESRGQRDGQSARDPRAKTSPGARSAHPGSQAKSAARPASQGQAARENVRPQGAPSTQASRAERPQQSRQAEKSPAEGRQQPNKFAGASAQPAANRNQGAANRPARGGFDQEAANRNKPGGVKKTKPNQRRFDDNKTGNMRNRKGQGKYRSGQDNSVRKEKIDNTPKKIIVRGTMTVGELAKILHKDASEVIKKLLMMGLMVTINQEVDLDTIQLIAEDYGVEMELKIPVVEDNFEEIEEQDEEQDLSERPPVVTIMGHVDHGKTTLLDAIRHTSVSEGEAGGITQHIGAYQVEINQKKITFLDTPGHEAFTTMRARGAQVTDITILVVAADDGVMPQTVEAINHAKAANVPIIIAVNKVDKPEANPDKIKQELTEYGLVPEEWGGDNIFVNVSAKQRTGLEELLEMILLVAEVQDLKANPDKRARGTIIEAELDKQRGPVARLLIQHGSLKIGDAFVAGVCFGRIRAMVNDRGRRIKVAGPSTPVEITGLTEVPLAGDPFLVFEDERKAKDIAGRRGTKVRQEELRSNSRVTLEDLYQHIKEGEIKEFNVIIKADVQGSLEALRGSLEKIDIEGVRVKTIHTAVGAINESDISLASASNAIVIGFNVRPETQAKITAEQEKVDIRLYRIIYKVIEEIEFAMKGMLEPEYKEVVIGHAEVRNVFKVSKIGSIAGCMVIDGKISRSAESRVVRNGIVIHEGPIDSLKRFKDDAKEVAQGYECGISFDKFNDIKEGDIIEAFVMETVER